MMEAALKCAAPSPPRDFQEPWVEEELLLAAHMKGGSAGQNRLGFETSGLMARSGTLITSSAAATSHRTTPDEIKNGIVAVVDRSYRDVTSGGLGPLD